jgi:hypothetical protein
VQRDETPPSVHIDYIASDPQAVSKREAEIEAVQAAPAGLCHGAL